MKERLIGLRQIRAALLAMLLASALSCGLLLVRRYYAGRAGLGMLVWNLFLAWVPLGASLVVYGLAAGRQPRWLVMLAAAVLWFLFFPNAAYIVTDLVHLRERPRVPYWYDIIAIMAFVQTGLFVGYLSLYLMQEVVRAWLGRWAGWAFALAMLALSGFGIYLGRFHRWNSWDALLEPLETVRSAVLVANPWSDPRPLTFSMTFFAFSLVCYLIVYSFTHLHGWARSPDERARRPN